MPMSVFIQPAGSSCWPGKEMAHSIKISLITFALSEQKEQKEEGKKNFPVRVGKNYEVK